MDAITYNLTDHYYKDITAFTDMVLENADNFLDFLDDFQIDKREVVLHTLMIGIYWQNYSKYCLNLNNHSKDLLNSLYNLRNEVPFLKSDVDELRGELINKTLLNEGCENDLSVNNLKLLFNWLESSGEYLDIVKNLNYFLDYLEINNVLFDILTFAGWFCKNAKKYLSVYTSNVSKFITKNTNDYIGREDEIFCMSLESEYYLNMLGAEILNRTLKADYDNRSRKSVVIPKCMGSCNNCKAVYSNLGFICQDCNNKCNISKIHKKGLKEGFETYIIPHGSKAFEQASKKDKSELGIVGVSCILNLIAGAYKASSLGIPVQCVIIDYVGCRHWTSKDFPTTINISELDKRLSI